MYNSKNRISAFIFIEDTFVQAETHTQCVINILIAENIIVGKIPSSYYNLEGMTNSNAADVATTYDIIKKS
mgnify:CR=1 FL=1